MISASSQPAPGAAPASATLTGVQQATLDGLAALIGRSAGVLAIHERGTSPFTEIVLWLEDHREPGELSRGEVAVLSHSRILQTVTLYMLDAQNRPEERFPSPFPTPFPSARNDSRPRFQAMETTPVPFSAGAEIVLEPAAATKRSFCEFWRADPAVKPTLIASGVSDVQIAPILGTSSGAGHPGAGHLSDPRYSKLRIGLTWPADQADQEMRASAQVDVRLFDF